MNDDSRQSRVTFTNIPTMAVVRRELSKARHQYFTFLPPEGCEFLAEYLQERVRCGERLDESSPVLVPGPASSWQRKNAFVRSG